MIIEFIPVLLLTAVSAPPPNACGAVVAGEAPIMPFFEQTLANGVAAGDYGVEFAAATVSMRARLVQWETRCAETAQRTAVQDLRRLASRSRSVAERTYVEALLAAALSRGPEIRAPYSRGGLFITARRASNAEREARRLFDGVLQRWPAPELLREYATLALATRDRSTLASADAALRAFPRAAAGDELHALHALLASARHDTAGAIALATRAAAATARARRLIAIVLMIAAAPSDDAGRLYLGALDAAGPDDVPLFYEDIWPLLDEDQERDWDALPVHARARWLREEWEWRASRSSRTVAERLRLHFQRAQHAIDWYPRLSFRGAPDAAALMIAYPPGTPFDDRGLLYLRHGQPDTLHIVGFNRQVWYYRHLDARRDDGVFTLGKPATRVDWVSLAEECTARISELSAVATCVRARRATETALRTENATPPFTRLLPGSLVTYAFRGARGETELVAYAALRAGSVSPRVVGAGVGYQFAATLAVEHPRVRQVERRDSLLTLQLATRPAAEQALRIGMSVGAQPDSLALVRVTILNAQREGEGQVLLTRRAVPSFADGTLALSDIVIAEPRAAGTLQRGTHQLAPLPGHEIAQGAAFRVFHETYGIAVATPAQVRITLASVVNDGLWSRLRGLISQRLALDLAFDDVLEPGPDGAAYLTRDVTAGLAPGRYSLRVAVTTAAATVARITEVTVIGR